MAALMSIFRRVVTKIDELRNVRFASHYGMGVGPHEYRPYRRKPRRTVPKELPPEIANRSIKVETSTDAIAEQGFVKSLKSYVPPSDVEAKIKAISSSVGMQPENDWRKTSLANALLKYKLLAECAKQLEHDVPNSCLHCMETAGDVLDFYLRPVEGTFSYDRMVQQQDKLPPNLHIIPAPLRFHPDTDTLFKGISAFPKSSTIISGLKWKKKYPGHDADFKWPDI